MFNLKSGRTARPISPASSLVVAHELLILQDIIPFFTPEDKAWILGGTARAVYNL